MKAAKKAQSQKWVPKAATHDASAMEDARVQVRRYANSSKADEDLCTETQPRAVTEEQVPQAEVVEAAPAPPPGLNTASAALPAPPGLTEEVDEKPPLPWNNVSAAGGRRATDGSWMESIVHQLRAKGNAVQTSMGQIPEATPPTATTRRNRYQSMTNKIGAAELPFIQDGASGLMRAAQAAAARAALGEEHAGFRSEHYGPPGMFTNPVDEINIPAFADGYSPDMGLGEYTLDAFQTAHIGYGANHYSDWSLGQVSAFDEHFLSTQPQWLSSDAGLSYGMDPSEMQPMQIPLPEYSAEMQDKAQLTKSSTTPTSTISGDSDKGASSGTASVTDGVSDHSDDDNEKSKVVSGEHYSPALRQMALALNLKEQKMKDVVEHVFALGWKNIEWKNSYTGVHLAAELGEHTAMPLLVLLGADVSQVDYKGRTAKDVARKKGHWNCVEALKKLSSTNSVGGAADLTDAVKKVFTPETELKRAR